MPSITSLRLLFSEAFTRNEVKKIIIIIIYVYSILKNLESETSYTASFHPRHSINRSMNESIPFAVFSITTRSISLSLS